MKSPKTVFCNHPFIIMSGNHFGMILRALKLMREEAKILYSEPFIEYPRIVLRFYAHWGNGYEVFNLQ